MAQLDEIVGKQNIDQFIELDAKINKVTESYVNLLKVVKETKADIGNTDSYTKLKTAQDETISQTKKLSEAEKEAAKIEKEQAAAVAALDKQRQSSYAAIAKQEAKEREMTDALNKEAKTLDELTKQNKALVEQRKKVDTSTKEGAATIKQINSKIDENNKKIKENVSNLEQQKINIGNYGSALKGVGTKLLGLASAFGATVGAVQIFKSIIASTQGVGDKFAQMIEGTKQSFEFLMRSIANVDFSNLINGLRDAYNEGVRYATALDDIADKQRALGIQKEDIETQIIAQRIIAKNRQNDLDTRKAAIDEIVRLEKLKLDKTQEVTGQAVKNELENAAQISGAGEELIKDFVTNYDQYSEKLKEGAKLQEYLDSLVERVQLKSGGYITSYAKRDEAVKKLSESQKQLLVLMQLDNNLIDEKRDKIAAALKANISATNENLASEEMLVRLKNRLNSELLKANEDVADEEIEITKNKVEQKAQIEAETIKGINKGLVDYIKKLDEAADEIDSAFDIPDPEQEVDPWIKSLEDIKKYAEDAYKSTTESQRIENEKKIADLKEYYRMGLISEQEFQAAMEKLKEEGPDGKDKKDQERQDKITAAQMTGEALYGISQMFFNMETADLERKKAYELKLAGDNAAEKEKIEKKYDKEMGKLKTKQAKADKAFALFGAIINVARAVSTAMTAGPGIGLVLAMLTAALGAIQVGIIATQPIPQFFKGTESAPDGVISVAEKGQELIKTRSGKTLLAKNRTLLSGMKGATIYSNKETEAILKAGRGGYDSKELRETLEKNNRELIKTIRDKREIHLQAPKGSRITERKGDYYTHYLTRKGL